MTGTDVTQSSSIETTAVGTDSGPRVAGVAGAAAAFGSVLLTASTVLQQRGDIPRGDALGVLAHVDARPWSAAALVAVLGMLCWASALPVLARAMTGGAARAAGRMAGPPLVVAVAVFAVEYAHDGYGSALLARQWTGGLLTAADAASDQRVVEVLVGGTAMLSQTLVGLALAVFAVATLLDRQYPRALAWPGVVAAFGWFLAGAALFLDLPGGSFAVLVPFSTLATLWLLVLGGVLVRRGVSPAAHTGV